MVRLDLVRDKISRLRDTAAWLRACLPDQAAAMAASRDVRDLVSFRVYLVMQEAIDLVISKQDEQGRWKLENTFNGRFQVDIEQRNQPSKWITLNAVKVMKRLYG